MTKTQPAKSSWPQTATEPSLRLVTPMPVPHWHRAGLFRLFLAEVIDRCLPLPWLAFFFPTWTLVVLAYHVLCDCRANRRSLGKWICRLRVVETRRTTTCAWWRAALQRLGIAVSQAAWSLWIGVPYLLTYELVTLVFALLSPTGQRVEEYLAGTLVVTEKTYQRNCKQATK